MLSIAVRAVLWAAWRLSASPMSFESASIAEDGVMVTDSAVSAYGQAPIGKSWNVSAHTRRVGAEVGVGGHFLCCATPKPSAGE